MPVSLACLCCSLRSSCSWRCITSTRVQGALETLWIHSWSFSVHSLRRQQGRTDRAVCWWPGAASKGESEIPGRQDDVQNLLGLLPDGISGGALRFWGHWPSYSGQLGACFQVPGLSHSVKAFITIGILKGDMTSLTQGKFKSCSSLEALSVLDVLVVKFVRTITRNKLCLL